MAIKFAKRKETNGIAVVNACQYDAFSATELEQVFRRKGEVNLGFHFLLHEDGRLEAGIPLEQYARSTLRRARDCVYVLATSEKTNRKQRARLQRLADDLNLEVVDYGNNVTAEPRSKSKGE